MRAKFRDGTMQGHYGKASVYDLHDKVVKYTDLKGGHVLVIGSIVSQPRLDFDTWLMLVPRYQYWIPTFVLYHGHIGKEMLIVISVYFDVGSLKTRGIAGSWEP